MNVLINGENYTASTNDSSLTLNELLLQTNPQPPFAVAVNGEFVSQSDYSGQAIQAQDRIDIVSPIFGG